MPAEDDVRIELVAPAEPDSPVRSFLEKGGGLHHVCYEVPDLERALDEARLRKCVLVRSPKPAVAFAGRRIAWVITPEKLLIEYLEAQHI
jgi:methylmalonyl-CoA/ethylmalonyl-CoA epimerase